MGNKQYLVDDINSHNYDSVNSMSFEEEMKKFRNSIGDSEKKKYTYVFENFLIYINITYCNTIRRVKKSEFGKREG